MVTLTEFVANLTPSVQQLDKALHVGLFATVLATFFVVPIYTVTHGDETSTITILDDMTNTKGNERAQLTLVPVYYTYFAFVLLGLIAQIFKAFYPTVAEEYLRANWGSFIAAIIAAYAADQVAILVNDNTRPKQLVPMSSEIGGLSVIALAVPAITICFDAYKISL